jgi:glycosyltransferase involved in cell wall biosynthesis
VTYAGVLNRPALLSLCRTSDVGLVIFAADTTDPNEATMVGASNKAFEYLACGLPLLVGPGAEWQDVFGTAGVALSCDPAEPRSIATALGRFHADVALRQAMGERGRQLVLSEWNYERRFAPVLEAMMKVRS